jgi:hypothetical protein
MDSVFPANWDYDRGHGNFGRWVATAAIGTSVTKATMLTTVAIVTTFLLM